MNTPKPPFFFSWYNETIETHNSFPILDKDGRPVFEVKSMDVNGRSREYIMLDKNRKVVYMIWSTLVKVKDGGSRFLNTEREPRVSIVSREKAVGATKQGEYGKMFFVTPKGTYLVKPSTNGEIVQVVDTTGVALDYRIRGGSGSRFTTRINHASSPLLFLALAIGFSLAYRVLYQDG